MTMDATPLRKRKFKHLTWEKRLQIEALFKAGFKARKIAKENNTSFNNVIISMIEQCLEKK